MAWRVPVLGKNNMCEAPRERVHERHDFVAFSDGQSSARHEIGLNIHRKKDVVAANRDRRRYEDHLL